MKRDLLGMWITLTEWDAALSGLLKHRQASRDREEAIRALAERMHGWEQAEPHILGIHPPDPRPFQQLAAASLDAVAAWARDGFDRLTAPQWTLGVFSDMRAAMDCLDTDLVECGRLQSEVRKRASLVYDLFRTSPAPVAPAPVAPLKPGQPLPAEIETQVATYLGRNPHATLDTAAAEFKGKVGRSAIGKMQCWKAHMARKEAARLENQAARSVDTVPLPEYPTADRKTAAPDAELEAAEDIAAKWLDEYLSAQNKAKLSRFKLRAAAVERVSEIVRHRRPNPVQLSELVNVVVESLLDEFAEKRKSR